MSAIYTQMLKDAIDPNLEVRLKKERVRQQQLDEQEALTKLEARVTVQDLFIRWRDIGLIERRDTKEITRMFEKDVLPVIGNLFVEDVRKSHITLITDALLARG